MDVSRLTWLDSVTAVLGYLTVNYGEAYRCDPKEYGTDHE
jgi:hypothetical protein